MRAMLEHFFFYWNEWAMSLLCALTAACCFLRINSLPRVGSTSEKLTMYFMGLGAFGLAISPFCGYFSEPNFFELLFVSGTVIVALRLTREEWRELLPRAGPVGVGAKIAQGVSTEEEDTCFH